MRYLSFRECGQIIGVIGKISITAIAMTIIIVVVLMRRILNTFDFMPVLCIITGLAFCMLELINMYRFTGGIAEKSITQKTLLLRTSPNMAYIARKAVIFDEIRRGAIVFASSAALYIIMLIFPDGDLFTPMSLLAYTLLNALSQYFIVTVFGYILRTGSFNVSALMLIILLADMGFMIVSGIAVMLSAYEKLSIIMIWCMCAVMLAVTLISVFLFNRSVIRRIGESYYD